MDPQRCLMGWGGGEDYDKSKNLSVLSIAQCDAPFSISVESMGIVVINCNYSSHDCSMILQHEVFKGRVLLSISFDITQDSQP